MLRSFSPVLPTADSQNSERAAKQYFSDCVIHLRRLEAVTERLRRSMEGPAEKLNALRSELERQTRLLAEEVGHGRSTGALRRQLRRVEALTLRELDEAVRQLGK